jgi:hypothetical protein
MSGIKKGSHVAIDCSAAGIISYQHHAIYVGKQATRDGSETNLCVIERSQNGVHLVRYSEFRGRGHTIVVKSPKSFSKDEIVRRAMARRSGGSASADCAEYCLLTNNCEHFANWCRSGNHVSQQLRDATKAAVLFPVKVILNPLFYLLEDA